MKMFIWERVECATENWHDEGGIVVIADTLERARELIAPKTGKEGTPCAAMTAGPDVTRECEGPEFISIFPDAGCC